jgi:hypothetical protein
MYTDKKNGTMSTDFDEIEQALSQAGAHMRAAEAHGMLCGIICSGGQLSGPSWQEEVLAGSDPQNLLVVEATATLAKLAQHTLQAFESESFALELLLPDDTQSLAQRTTALAQWCQGFYMGLSMGGISDIQALPEDSREVLQDMVDVAQLEGDESVEGEEDEAAYAEVVEYVRMGVLLVREELRKP